MPTRANAIGRYDGLAPELQDTLRRNGMQARLVQRDGDVLLAVQGHDSPLLTYPLSQSHLKALTDGGTNSSNRKAYDAFAAVVGADFHLPKDYVHARNANGRVTMGLHGYRIGEGEYGRTVSPFVDLWARRSLLGWTPRQQEGYHLRRLGGELRYGGAPLLGLKGLVVKAHGSSKAVEIKNAVAQCALFYEEDVNGKIKLLMEEQAEKQRKAKKAAKEADASKEQS